jgi:glucosamine-6-phosphate deaminase
VSSPAPLVLADADRVGRVAAELIRNRLLARPGARLLLPARADDFYAALAPLPAGRATVLQTDELLGVAPPDSRAAALRASLRGLGFGTVVTMEGSADVTRHAAALEAAPIDAAVLVLGADGHVALDEPPARRASGVRVVSLAPDSRAAGAVAGLTVGLGSLYLARELIVLATGAEVAGALRAMLEDPVGPASPAALLRDHPRLTVICDRAAAALLEPRPQFTSDRALVVLGHREPGISAEHRISHESRARLRHARELAEQTPVRAVVLTGYTSTGGLSEAEQMKTAWDDHDAPALLEVAGRDTAENASRSLPILLALGEVGRVTVVSSAWHIRVPFFFAPYRRFGLRVDYRASFAHGAWPRMLAHELRAFPYAPAQRRAAVSAIIAPREPHTPHRGDRRRRRRL